MYISHVHIEGIRCFRSGELGVDLDLQRPDGSLAGWTVIAGRNGAGKSTFLRAIALVVVGPQKSMRLQESFAGWIRDGNENGGVGLSIIPDKRDGTRTGRRYEHRNIGLTWDLSGGDAPIEAKPTIFAIDWPRSAQERTKFTLHRVPPSEYQAPAAITAGAETPEPENGAEDGPWAAQPQGWFMAGYGPFRRLSGHTADVHRLMQAPPPVARLVSLFREEASLADCIAWLQAVNYKRLEGKPGARELEEAVLRLLDDGLLPDKARVVKVDSDGLWVEQGGVRMRLQQLSDGYRAVVSLILDIARQLHECYSELPLIEHDGHLAVDLPGVVLIDEVDAHLHVSWQQRIGFWLKQRFPRVQFIVSTHSPFICQAADPRGLIRLPAPGEDRRAEHVSDELYRQIVNGSVDDAVLSDLFGLEHSRSPEAEHKVEELAALEVKVLDGNASESEQARYEALKAELPLGPSQEVERVLLRLEQTIATPSHDKDSAGH